MFEACAMFETVQVTPVQKVADGINAARMLLPKWYFDAQRCAKGVDSVENYRKKLDHKTGEFMDSPVHDKHSHGADAFRYLAINYDPMLGDVAQRANSARVRTGGVSQFSKPRVIRTGAGVRRF
jgi:hypothetical protein